MLAIISFLYMNNFFYFSITKVNNAVVNEERARRSLQFENLRKAMRQKYDNMLDHVRKNTIDLLNR